MHRNSAHRYVIQQRLKRSGGWWRVENAWAILALRVLRVNQDWQPYAIASLKSNIPVLIIRHKV